ncbi:MAG: PAS domain S-box protein [Acidobacteria bacterium]|nr:PAS domain S-box protein [Acidobacteriota bacterium]
MKQDTIQGSGQHDPIGGSREILDTIVETMPGAVYVAEWIEGRGLQYGTIYESPSIEQFTGIPPRELTAHPGTLLNLVHPDDRREMVDALYSAVNSQVEVEVTYRIRNARSGEVKWIHERIRSIKPAGYSDRRVIIGVMMDVTKLRDAEQKLQQAQERMRLLVEGTPYLFFYTQDSNGDVTYVSPSVERLTGYSVEEWLGQRHWFTTENRINDPARAATHEHLRGEMTHPAFQFEIRHKNGNAVLLETYEHPIVVDGEVKGIQGVARDVTEQRRLQEALLESRKMEAVGRLAAGLAHDFNNMLQGILACADLISAQCREEVPRKLADEIIAISGRGANLVQQLLAYSRRQVFEPAPIDVNELIEENAPFLQRLLGDDIDVSLDLAEHLPPILGDRGQLEQVFLNLASNAREAMGGGGTFTVTTGVSGEREDRGDLKVILTIRDQGQGIDDELLDKIFEPYFTTRAAEGGTGLGLASVKGIVEQHNGDISVTSSVGEGTTFVIRFPAVAGSGAETSAARAHEGPAPPARAQTGTILLVDDNADVRHSVRDILEFSGYTIITAATVSQASKILQEHDFDLLLTDLQLPDGSGLDIISLVRERKHPGLPIILMSGYPRGGLPNNITELPDAVLFLEKPVRIGALLEAINTGLARREAEPG